MKILFISHLLPYPPRGGAFQRTYNLLRETGKSNEVFLLAIAQRAHQDSEQKMCESVDALKKICRYVKAFRVTSDSNFLKWNFLLLANLLSRHPYSVMKFACPELAAEIRRLTAKEKFDLVHFDTIDLAEYAELTYGLPSVMNHHNIESQLLLRRAQAESNPVIKAFMQYQANKLRKYEQAHCGKFDMNLVVSDQDLQGLSQLAPRARFAIVPNGTDTDYFKPAPQTLAPELIFIGGLKWYPNKDAMLFFCERIFPLILKRIPEVSINIIGREPPPGLKNLAAQYPSIKLHGFVEDIRDLLARSSVYVVPIRVGGGTRLKILDAFASGKAVVSTSIGAEGIRYTNGENILIADTAELFATRVIELLENKELRSRLGTNARKLAEKEYSWQIIGKRLNQIYSEIASGNQKK